MTAPRACVLRAPGTNCDRETAFAFEQAGAISDRVHLFRLLENPALLNNYEILCVAGGFSYGDDIGAGVIFSRQLQGQLNEALQEFRSSRKLILGICNGFQVILKAGLLGSVTSPDETPTTTLTWNANGMYTDRWVRLKVANQNNAFLQGMEEFDVPIAHAEGRVAVASPDDAEKLRAGKAIALQYTWPEGTAASSASDSELLPEPHNPNGSVMNIAGLSDASGQVLGLMPHPERFLFAHQHPQWTRRNLRGEGAGMQLFRNAVDYFAAG